MTKSTMTNDELTEKMETVASLSMLATFAGVAVIAVVRPRAVPPYIVGLLAGYTVGASAGIAFGPASLAKRAAR